VIWKSMLNINPEHEYSSQCKNIVIFVREIEYSREMLDYDNHPEIQCRDPEITDVQVYHSGHHKDLDPL
jgi:hypothetical protein